MDNESGFESIHRMTRDKSQLAGERTQLNLDAFRDKLTEIYRDLFANDPEYAYSASKCSAEELSRKMVLALDCGTGNKAGKGIERACKYFGISHTYKAIRTFLSAQ